MLSYGSTGLAARKIVFDLNESLTFSLGPN